VSECSQPPEAFRSISPGPTKSCWRTAGPDREEYRPEAITLIEEELARRNLDDVERDRLVQNIAQERREQELESVRGWLLFFALVVLGNSLPLVFDVAFYLGRNLLTGALALPAFSVGVYGCYVFVLLVRKRPTAPRHAARWVIAMSGLTLFSAGMVYLKRGEIILTPLYGLAQLAWLGYLGSSKRVLATYGRPSQEGEPVGEAFG